MPISEVVLREPKAAGIARVTSAVRYPVELLQNFFDDGKRLGRQSDYFFEEGPLDTVGLPTLIGRWRTRQSF